MEAFQSYHLPCGDDIRNAFERLPLSFVIQFLSPTGAETIHPLARSTDWSTCAIPLPFLEKSQAAHAI